jgi:hypothetical protein
MKNLSIYFLIITLGILFTQCKNENNMENDLPQTKHTLVVESGEIVIHPITDAIPIEGGFEITKQASFYNRSEIVRDGKKAAIEYQYQSLEGFVGLEIVEITSYYSIGDSNMLEGGKIILTIQVK